MRDTDCRTRRFTLFASAAFAAATLLSSTAGRAVTPIDWNLVVNVRPLVPYLHPTSEDRITVLLSGDSTPGCEGLSFEPPVVSGTTIRFQGHRGTLPFECTPFIWTEELELPRLNVLPGYPGRYKIEVYDEDLLIRSQPLEVIAPGRQLILFDAPAGGPVNDSVIVTVELTDPVTGPPRPASAVFQTNSAGYFWFFDPNNVEVTVKVVDGRPVNGHFWIFLTGMSNLGFTVTVTHVSNCAFGHCPQKTYVNPSGQRLNVIDTELP